MTVEIGFAAVAIGMLLGMLGGGGSVLTVPMLVYLAHLEPKLAIATSLLVVGTTSAVAMLPHARQGNVCWRAGGAFGGASMIGAYGGGRLAALLPGQWLMLMFAGLMLATGAAMLLRKERDTAAGANTCPRNAWVLLAIALQGIVVGALTGLVGAGGGFVVVPALCLLGGLSMRSAIGTSLLIIAVNSFSGLAGYISHVQLDGVFAGLLAGIAVLGSLIGTGLAPHVSARALRRAFALFVIAVAVYLLHRELGLGDWLLHLATPCQLWITSAAVAVALVLQHAYSRLRLPR